MCWYLNREDNSADYIWKRADKPLRQEQIIQKILKNRFSIPEVNGLNMNESAWFLVSNNSIYFNNTEIKI